ncbi:MAG: hypothetical protein ACI3ZY_13625 [Parabacteroides sp.]
MRKWLISMVMIGCSCLGFGQKINHDFQTSTIMLARFAETTAQLEVIAAETASQQKASRQERLKADTLMEQTINRFFDYAPGIVERTEVWALIEGLLTAGKDIAFKDGQDTILTKKLKEIRVRFISPDKAKTIPGDRVWRDYMDFFKQAEKVLTGTNHFGGIVGAYEQIQGFASGNVANIGSAVLNKVQQKGTKKEDEKPLLTSDYIKDATMRKAFYTEAENIILQVVRMHKSWVPSADKRTFYDTKRQELMALAGSVRKGFSLDYVIGSDAKGQSKWRDLINEDYGKYLNYGREKY